MELRAGLAKMQGSTAVGAVYELFRAHRWEIFGQEQDMSEVGPLGHGPQAAGRGSRSGTMGRGAAVVTSASPSSAYTCFSVMGPGLGSI